MSEITLILASLRHNTFAILVNTTWQVTLFIIFVWLLMKALRVKTPTTRYGFWLLAVLSPVVFPLLSMLTPRMNILNIVKVEDAVVVEFPNVAEVARLREFGYIRAAQPKNSVDIVSSVDVPFVFPTETPRTSSAALPLEHVSPTPIEGFPLPSSFPDAVIAFWLIGASLMFLRLARSYRRLLKLKSDAIELDDGVVPKIAAELRQRMGIKKDVELFASEKVACPISFGITPAKIILPNSVLNNPKRSEFEPMLAHELAHIKRYDYAVNLLQRILEAIFFFHPLFHLASRNLTKEREYICDD